MNLLRIQKFLFLLSFSIATSLSAQNVGINTTGANPSTNAILDLNTGNNYNTGFIIPHVTLGASLTTFSPPIVNSATTNDTGMVVYNMNGPQPAGYYYWTGTTWASISGSPTAWQLTGNSGTVPGTNFIGTTDANALEFKVDNQKAGWMDYTSPNNTSFGWEAENAITTGINNTAVGYTAMQNNTAEIAIQL